RDLPPLVYPSVYRLKQERPDLTIAINGGINDLETAAAQLPHTDGVMLGRAPYQNPYILAEVDGLLFGDPTPAPSRHEAAALMSDYADRMVKDHDVRVGHISRHMVGLFQGIPGARAFRRHLSENAFREGATGQVIRDAAALVPDQQEKAAA
ncbi:MAG: tRNA-dihydrouridine synthase, partial [Alphaproteobacteria bacterium]